MRGKSVLLAVAALVLGSLAIACGGGGGGKQPNATPTAAGTAVPKELDPATILQQNSASVVQVMVTSPEGDRWGSGIVWQDPTHVLTNAHVVIGAGSVKVVDPRDSTRTFPAKVVALSPCDDVALLSVDRAVGLKPASIGASEVVKPGDHVVALGFPGTISSGPATPILTEGNVSRVHATFDFGGQRDLIQHTSPINPGNSGGPLFNRFGQVIGLNAYSARGKQSENYAISIDEASAVAAQLQKGKNLDYLGVSLEPNSRDYAQENKLAYIDGLAITGIDPGSPADKANLDWGYLIFSVNGTEVDNIGQFCDIVRSHSSGDTLRIQFGAWNRNGNPEDDFVSDVVLP